MSINIRNHFNEFTTDELKELYKKSIQNEIVMILNPDMDRNIGSIIRTASASYFSKCVIIGRRKTNFISAVGMNHYMPIEYVNASIGTHNDKLDIPKIIEYLSELSKTHTIILCEIAPNSITLKNMNSNIKQKGKPPAFLLGNEQNGIPDEIINSDKFDKIIVEIPIIGFTRSYNVSNSFSMIYWEYIREKN
jgi:tRNA G18 (ribose-2'-O)-methylase SpoU